MEFNEILLCEETRNQLCHCLRMAEVPNLVLAGGKGAGKCETAIAMAGMILGCENPLTHPYVRLVKSEKGLVSKAQIDELIGFTQYEARQRKIYIIDDADFMTDEAQNGLLKLLEDQADRCLVFLVAHRPLIPTIESRCIKVSFGPVSKEAFLETLQGEAFDETVWMAAGGRIGAYRELLDEDFSKKAKELKNAIFYGKKADVLRACGCLKEKDNSVLTAAYTREQMDGFLCYLKAVFVDSLKEGVEENRTISLDMFFVREVLEALDKASALNRRKQFHANELFSLLRLINGKKGE